MRLVTFAADGGTGVGVLREGGIAPAPFADMLDLIRGGDAALASIRGAARAGPLMRGARVLAPIPRPRKLLFCGINYRSHQQEDPGAKLPVEPFFFSKLPSAVIGPGEPIVVPSPASQVDPEVELAVVIGRRSRSLDEASALDAVFGYTLVNDVSARDVQFKDAQITLGKGFDTFCPMGPSLVTRDEIPDPSRLRLTCTVNGEVRQNEGTAGMLFAVARLLAILTQHITLDPGDVVSTGTPAGVGLFRTPPIFLRPGDRVTVSCPSIGELTNPVVGRW